MATKELQYASIKMASHNQWAKTRIKALTRPGSFSMSLYQQQLRQTAKLKHKLRFPKGRFLPICSTR